MILISQWYEPADDLRRKELEEVRAANASLGVFKKVVYEDGRASPVSFTSLLSFAAREFPGEACVISNTDIVFDWSAIEIERQCRPRRVVTLTRWKLGANSPQMIGHTAEDFFFSGTQDAWAFIAGEVPVPSIDIPMGVTGCDQLIAGWFLASKCEIVNPSYTIVSRHAHSLPNDHSRSLSVAGLFGYPAMETASPSPSGLVMFHNWTGNEKQLEMGIAKTCRS